jgi:putative ABC transport system permease protein
MRSLAFIALAIKRLGNKVGLTCLLILSFALTIGLLACVPMFTDAVGKQIMQEEITRRIKTQNAPPFPLRILAMPRTLGTLTLEEAEHAQQWVAQLVERELRLPIASLFVQLDSPAFYLQPRPGDTRYEQSTLGTAQVSLSPGIAERIEIVAGEPIRDEVRAEYLNVWVERSYADELAVQPGEVYQLADPTRRADPVQVRIAGIWQARDPADRFWPNTPARLFNKKFLTTTEQYRAHIYPTGYQKAYFTLWYFVLDDTKMSLGQAERYIKALGNIERELDQNLPIVRMDLAPLAELEKGQQRKIGLSAILFGFSLPLIGVLIYFMASVSTMVARFQRQEMATLASRGSGRLQILALVTMEILILLAVATPLGLAMGWFLAHVMSSTRSFLHFAPGPPAEVHLASVDWRLVGLGMAVSAISRWVPSALATNLTVVTYEQWHARRREFISSMRFLPLGLLVFLTIYTYRQLALKGSLNLIGLQPGDPSFDPLLLLAPSLFLLTVPFVAAELFALLMRPLTWVGKLLRSAAGFLGCMSLGREGGQYRTPVYMLVLCLSSGVFFASLALSADTWQVDRRRYEVGADLTFEVRDLSALAAMGTSTGEIMRDSGDKIATSAPEVLQLDAFTLPISEYQRIEGVRAATRVAQYEAAIVANQRIPKGRLLAIDRLTFPQVIYFRSDYAPDSLGGLMNRLGAIRNGVLLPRKLAEEMQVAEGDRISVRVMVGEEQWQLFDLVIAGTFDYFPTMTGDGEPLLVANLEDLQNEAGGGLPWGVWMRLEPEADVQEILNAVLRMGVVPAYPRDLRLRLERDQQQLERVGTFGMLSVCFLAGAILASLGLLVYSMASMMGRTIRFAIWQAIGLRRSEVMKVVSVEYLLTLLYSLVAGTAGGILASRLYVPLLRLTDSPAVPIPPFVPLVDWQRALLMATSIGLGLVVVEAILLVRIARTRVFEVLRMGTRE